MRLRRLTLPSLAAGLALTACGGAEARPKPTGSDAAKVQPATAANAAPAASDDRVKRADLSRIKGDSAAKVWLVIVSDFQCPYCKLWHDSTGTTIEKEYVATGKVRMAYVNFPLRMHQHAREASEAAMCAGSQGKFWEFGDRLFATQPDWAKEASATAAFDSIGMALGLDMPAWRSCLNEHVMSSMIDADYDRGVKANVNSTPTFFVGQEVIEGAEGIAKFRAAFDKALAAAK